MCPAVTAVLNPSTFDILCVVQPVALPLDAQCNPVHAYQYNKANTIFQAARAAGKTTAWIDKGPYYELVQVCFSMPSSPWAFLTNQGSHVTVLCLSLFAGL